MTRAQRSYYVWVQVFPHVTLSIVENAFSFLSTVGCYVTCNICYILLLDNSRCWVTFPGRVILFTGVELCWNVYPSNLYSSALLLGLHLVILFGLWSAPSEYPYVDKKVSTQDKHKWSFEFIAEGTAGLSSDLLKTVDWFSQQKLLVLIHLLFLYGFTSVIVFCRVQITHWAQFDSNYREKKYLPLFVIPWLV